MLGLFLIASWLHPLDVTVTQTGLAGVVVVALSVGSSYFTSQAASKAAVRTAEVSSRTKIEEGAFERAKGYYTDVITRQDAELAEERRERAAETGALREELTGTKSELRTVKSELRSVKGELVDAQREIAQLRADTA